MRKQARYGGKNSLIRSPTFMVLTVTHLAKLTAMGGRSNAHELYTEVFTMPFGFSFPLCFQVIYYLFVCLFMCGHVHQHHGTCMVLVATGYCFLPCESQRLYTGL